LPLETKKDERSPILTTPEDGIYYEGRLQKERTLLKDRNTEGRSSAASAANWDSNSNRVGGRPGKGESEKVRTHAPEEKKGTKKIDGPKNVGMGPLGGFLRRGTSRKEPNGKTPTARWGKCSQGQRKISAREYCRNAKRRNRCNGGQSNINRSNMVGGMRSFTKKAQASGRGMTRTKTLKKKIWGTKITGVGRNCTMRNY